MKSSTRNWGQWVFVLVMVGCVQFIVLTTVAMFHYPGGTYSNHDTVGFSFWTNFFSDLGRRAALSGDPNTISRWLSVIADCGLGLLLCLGFAAFPRLFGDAKSASRFAFIGSIFGIISSVSLCFVNSLAAEDLHPLTHGIVSVISNVTFIVAAGLYAAAIFRNRLYPNAYAYILLAFIIIEVLLWGTALASPGTETEWGNRLEATLSKMEIYAYIICISIQAYGALRVHKQLRDLSSESILEKG